MRVTARPVLSPGGCFQRIEVVQDNVLTPCGELGTNIRGPLRIKKKGGHAPHQPRGDAITVYGCVHGLVILLQLF